MGPKAPHSQYEYDILVVGAGHAGAEAALAAVRMGARTALLSTSLDAIARMSCNPAIGGVGKGQIVREIDALGGAMGRVIDVTGIQFRMLNRRKGPAMHGPRAQADKNAYHAEMKRVLEEQENLTLRQETVVDLVDETSPQGRPRVVGVRTEDNAEYRAGAVIVSAGTFMSGMLHVGPVQTPGGRAGEGTTDGLGIALRRLGIRVERFKTGTPPRLNGRTIDYDKTELQPGDVEPQPFSFMTGRLNIEQVPCHITYTNEAVHEAIRANLDRAPLYTGQIQTTGPRYCPSIEDKVVRFAEKTSHQVFLEPEGRNTLEVYANGISTSLPRDVQQEMVRLIPGLEKADIIRFGYAIEYDFCPPEQLHPSMAVKQVDGLYLAGQINGTTGYEEAAAQGLLAGANAALALRGEQPIVFERDEAYIGVMVDDLVSRGVDEPYRMFTSRAEYRLQLRQDNADRRLTPRGVTVGLVDDARRERFEEKLSAITQAREVLQTRRHGGITLEKYLRRPEATWAGVVSFAPELAELSTEAASQLEYDIRYAGYIARQEIEIARQRRLSQKRIPDHFDYEDLTQMRHEARQKLSRFRPTSIGHASRIPGITPADITLLMLHLSGKKTTKTKSRNSPQEAGD